MKFNVHAGHNPKGKVACGAVGYLDESVENRKVKDLLIGYLKSQGHTVYDCTCENGLSQNDVLQKIVSKCNSHSVDCDISIHLNAGGGTGSEVEIFGTGGKAETFANKVMKSIANRTGYKNRGVKVRPDLYVLRKTDSPSILIECCFVDTLSDKENWNVDKMAKAICEGLTGVYPSTEKITTIRIEKECNAHKSNDSDSKVLANMKGNVNIHKLDNTKNWIRCYGYISKAYLDISRNKAITKSNMNIRYLPTTDSAIIGKTSKGTVFEVISENDRWAKVEFYIPNKYLK